jgi:hypothetical protein
MRSLPVLTALLRSSGAANNRRRWIILIVVGLLAVAAGLYVVESARQSRQQQAAAGLVEARARAIAKAKALALARAKSAVAAAPKTLLANGRVVPSTQAADLFAPHSWYVAPPPPPPAAEEAPAAPTAPPLPYTYVGSYAPSGERATYFLARGDRVVDAHVGDKLDGSLLFEKVEGGQLVFNYLPLNIRQTLPAGVVQ